MKTNITKNTHFNDLLKIISELNASDLEKLTSEVIQLRAKRRSASLSHKETELFLKINAGLPIKIQKRFDELNQKRINETLSQGEHEELIELTEQIEDSNANRISYIAKLANLRGITLSEMMNQFNFLSNCYGK